MSMTKTSYYDSERSLAYDPDRESFYIDSRFSNVRETVCCFGTNNVILDVGCGNGWLSSLFMERNTVYGLDISWKNTERARQRGVKAIQHDASQELPFLDSSFDIVVCLEIIEHLFNPEEILREIYRVLKNEGALVLTTPNLHSLNNRLGMLFGRSVPFIEYSGEFYGHIRFFTRQRLRQILRGNGFRILHMSGNSFWYIPYVGKIASAITVLLQLPSLFRRLVQLDSAIMRVSFRENKYFKETRLGIIKRLDKYFPGFAPGIIAVCQRVDQNS